MSDNSLVNALVAAEPVGASSKQYANLPDLPDGQTADELAVAVNKSGDWVRTRLKALTAQGRLLIGRKKIKDLTGREVWVPAYKVLDEPSSSL